MSQEENNLEPVTVQQGSQIMLGQPADYPQDLVNELQKVFKTIPDVNSAYLAHYHNPAADKVPHTLIGIDNVGNWGIMMSRIEAVLLRFDSPEKPIDVLKINKDQKGGLSEYLMLETKPFYSKQTIPY